MGYFYKKCQNLSKNERVLEQTEHGRSMVEMLGVLAIVGVLSVGAISGYRYAMNKYRANQTVNELNLLSHQVAVAMMSKNGVSGELKLGEPYDTNSKLITAGYEFTYGCGDNAVKETSCAGETSFSMKILNLPEKICQEIKNQGQYLQYIDEISGGCDSGSSNALLLTFNPEKKAGRVENGETTTTTVTTTTASETTTTETTTRSCSGHGTWSGTGCDCDYNWGGPDCSKCSGRAYFSHYTSGQCGCKEGYSGDDCEIEDANICSGNGRWEYGACVCFANRTGANCEISE